MLQVFQSNRLEVLVTLLSEQIKMPASDSIFAAETVMVHSPGMSQWLKLQLAEKNGIAANIDFPLPSSFIWRLYQHLLSGVPEESPFNKDKMSWRIYRLLPARLSEPSFSAVEQYLAVTKPVSQTRAEHKLNFEQLRRFQLAEKIADVFDNYLMYRQHWLEHWQAGFDDLPEDGSSDDIGQQQWQAILWRDLVADIENSYRNNTQASPLSRAHMHEQLMTRLAHASTEELQGVLPKRLFVFGISALPKAQLEVLQALGQHIDVQVMWLNPCSLFWGDILSDKTLARISAKDAKQAAIAQVNIEQKEQYFIVGNPLLASWGKVGRDHLDNLTRAEIDIMDVFIDQAPSTLLQQIQQDILNLEFRGSQTPLTPQQIHSDFGKRSIDHNDDSILVHACHSQTRELEVLRDKLLGWFEQDPELQAKDILVMVPDIDAYAPFIDAVFSKKAQAEDSFIPYTIADRGGLLENPLLNTFNQLLLLPSSRFNVSELLDHLEVPVIMARFELSEAELALIKQWIADCQIKWAKDAPHKSHWQLPENELNTWVYGLKRMLLGLAIPQQGIWHNILAYQHIEGLNAQILGKLLNYFSFLLELETRLNNTYTIPQWHQQISQLVAFLFQQDSYDLNNQITIQKIREANQNLLTYLDDEAPDEFGYRIIQHYFVNALNESGVVQRFLAGSMNFCTLMPMRSVPFKVVCVLGLNEGDYPRQVDPISFDLVGLNTPRKGDRSRKHDDRYLFLEALVSARDKLHLSYIGQSSKNNNPLVPSVILSELLEYIQGSFVLPSEQGGALTLVQHLSVQHKLQPFNQDYFSPTGPSQHYISRDPQWYELALTSAGLNTLEMSRASEQEQTANILHQNKDTETENLLLERLIEFAVNPIRYFYRHELDIRLELSESELSDHEVFSHDGLDKFNVLTELIEKALLQQTVTPATYLRSGHFPVREWGESMYTDYQQQASALASHIHQLFGDDCQLSLLPLQFEYEPNKRLQGQLPVIETQHNGVKLFHSFELRAGDIRPQDKLSAWLRHLVKSACYASGVTLLIDKKGKLQWFDPISADDAQTLLMTWIALYQDQAHQLYKWHINLALAHIDGQNKGLSEQALHKKVSEQLSASSFGRNLADDPYVSKVITSLDQLEADFDAVNTQLIVPMVEALVVQSKSQTKPELFSQGEA